jgi:hypothetical protein
MKKVSEPLPEAVNTKEAYLITKNEELNSKNLSIEKKHKLVLDKTKFVDRLESKISKLSNKTILTQMKYGYYKWWYDILNIFIIFISSLLTIIEAIKNEVDYENQKDDIKYFFKLAPIIVSTIIVIISSILKFLRLQENLEIMARTTEKSILTIYRMKKVQEECYFASQEQLDSIQSTYLDEIFIMYNQCQAELGKCFKYNDLITYSNEKEKIILQGKKKKSRIHKRFKSKQVSSIDMDNPMYDTQRSGSFNQDDITAPMTPVGGFPSRPTNIGPGLLPRRRNPSVAGDFDLESRVFNISRDSEDGPTENNESVTTV